jgi:uncharacterized protein YvpB
MKLDIPFYSQFSHVTLEEWKERACAPTCLKMALDFLGEGKFEKSIDELINEGLEIRAYQDGVGWIHNGLVRLAHNHGFFAYSEEFRSLDKEIENTFVDKAIEKVKSKIDAGLPVIVSCSKNWGEVHKYHQVVVTGYDDAGFFYHEPHKESETDGAHRHVTFDTFCTHWRKFAIFLCK